MVTALRFFVWVLLTVPLGGAALAQEQQPDPTPEQIQQRRAAVEADESLDDDVRTATLGELQKALDALSRANEAKTAAARFQGEAEAAPVELEQVKAELSRPAVRVEPEVDPQWTATEVEARCDQERAAASDAEESLTGLEARVRRRSERDTAIEVEQGSARAKLTQVQADLENPPEQPHPALSDAVRWRLSAERAEARATIERLTAEGRRNIAETELMPLRIDLARRQLSVARATLASWEKLLREQRERDATNAAEAAARARSELVTRYPPLRQVVDEIERLTAQLSGPDGVVAKRNAAGEQQSIVDRTLEQTRKSHADAMARYRLGGTSSAFGLFLRLEYDKLPNRRQLRIEARRHKREIADAAYQALILRERRTQLGDVGARVGEFLAGVLPSESAAERARLEQAAAQLFGNERDLLGSLTTNFEAYVRELLRLDFRTGQLLAVTDSYEGFIREHILWVRSIDRPFALDAREFRDGALWLVRGDPEREELARLRHDFAQQWYLWTLLAVIFVVATVVRRRGVRRIEHAAPLVGRYKTDSLGLTGQVLGWTLVAALPVPLLVFGAGWIIEQNLADSTWRLGWVTALGRLTVLLLSFSILLQALRPNGLACAHFRWPDAPCRALCAAVRRFAIPAVVIAAVQVAVQYASDPAYRESIGRLLALVAIALWGAFAWRALAPKGPVLEPYYGRNPDNLLTRFRRLIFVLGVGMPAGIFVAIVIGYFFTARTFAGCLFVTLLLVFALLLVHGLAMRWLFFHRRRLAVDEAMQKRQEKEKEQQQTEEQPATELEVDADDDVDIPALDAHTRTLFRAAVVVALLVGLLSIWSPLFPALKALDRVQVWPSVRVLAVSETDAATAVPRAVAAESGAAKKDAPAAGAPSIPGMPPLTAGTSVTPADAEEARVYSLTLADLLTSLVLAIATFFLVRHVPALLEIGVLTRLPIDAGARYAIATIVRYVLFGIGIALTFGALGIGWSSIQWLAAALTFGLAFGLQEIFANFISGLILLVERPIRVGDTVTVGALTGTVARIRTRATTILDYDNRERLIPNKMLITCEVTNWTLSDSVTRVVIDVGVAYGSDTQKVCENLMRAATECPVAMEDPAPSVLFKGFGESALDFALRFYIPTRARWVEAMNFVNLRIDDLFREADIEIAFPQRDLHLRSVDAKIELSSDESATSR